MISLGGWYLVVELEGIKVLRYRVQVASTAKAKHADSLGCSLPLGRPWGFENLVSPNKPCFSSCIELCDTRFPPDSAPGVERPLRERPSVLDSSFRSP